MKKNKFLNLSISSLLCVMLALSFSAHANKPFTLASNATGAINDVVTQLKTKLASSEFTIAGEYTPYQNAHILVITSDKLKSIASKSAFGAYGAGVRVALTKVGNSVQLSYTNPTYWGPAFRMDEGMKEITAKLNSLLGKVKDFGSKKGVSDKELRKYHYMFAMPYFDEPLELAEHKSYQQALMKVEESLAKGLGGASKVYRIDIPGKEESVIGVKLTKEKSGDQLVMSIIDMADLKHTAHLCYEMVVSGKKVYALNGRFRIAVSFPDLTMGTFTKIMSTPGAIESSLEKAAGKQFRKRKSPYDD